MSGPLWYPLGRVWVKSLRPDAWATGSIPTAQIVSVVLIVIASVALTSRHRNRQAAPAEQAK